MAIDVRDLNTIVKEANASFASVRQEVGRVLIGQQALVESLLVGLLTGGHLLLEGVPGVAKTLAVRALSSAIDCPFQRIQFTPDLLPADLIGTSIYHPREGTFTTKKGPVFTQILLADEINRAPPKVQSALLEVMAEKQVTIGGETFPMADPFLVLATQNPIDQQGTYPLPEAQMDRFLMKVHVGYPTKEEERAIVESLSSLTGITMPQPVISGQDILEARKVVDDVYVDEKVVAYLLDIVFATRNPKDFGVNIEGLLEYGASPRASIALTQAAKAHAFLQGRGYVTPHDIKSVGKGVLRHRLLLSYEAEAEELTADDIIGRIFDTLLVP